MDLPSGLIVTGISFTINEWSGPTDLELSGSGFSTFAEVGTVTRSGFPETADQYVLSIEGRLAYSGGAYNVDYTWTIDVEEAAPVPVPGAALLFGGGVLAFLRKGEAIGRGRSRRQNGPS